jgi:hypothetical protein
VANESLIDDPAEYKAVLKFLQECGWPKDLSLSEILDSDQPGYSPPSAKVNAPPVRL